MALVAQQVNHIDVRAAQAWLQAAERRGNLAQPHLLEQMIQPDSINRMARQSEPMRPPLLGEHLSKQTLVRLGQHRLSWGINACSRFQSSSVRFRSSCSLLRRDGCRIAALCIWNLGVHGFNDCLVDLKSPRKLAACWQVLYTV